MATYYVEAGHGGTNSGTAANPWLTIDQAMGGLANGDVVRVKATADYTETVDVDGGLAAWDNPVIIEGYTDTFGDGGKVTIDGAGSRASGIIDSLAGSINYVFKNLIIKDHTSHAVDMVGLSKVTWKNCEFIGSTGAGSGVSVGTLHSFENCKFNDNVGKGCLCEGGALFIGCEFMRNGSDGIETSGHVVAAFCTFFSNGTRALDAGPGVDDVMRVMINCTVDGDGKDTIAGLYADPAARHYGAVINSVFYDVGTGIDFSCGEFMISRNNLVNNNTSDYANGAATHSGEVTAVPAFEDEVAGADYTPASGSALIEAGDDNGSHMDIGAIQSVHVGAADYPAEADVQSGVAYDSGGLTGNFTEPGIGNVESGVQYGGGGTEFTGTFAVPGQGDVQDSVDYGAGAEFTGTFTEPGVGNVESGVQYGAAGTEFTGTFAVPAQGDVQDSVDYGAAAEFTGTFTEPGVGNVESGTSYGAAGTEFDGTFEEPGVANVLQAVSYGAGGTEFTGTLTTSAGGGGSGFNHSGAL